MKIQILLCTAIFALGACQPEQMRWRSDPSLTRSSSGELVFDALYKSLGHQDKCLTQRETILSSNKEKFVNEFNKLSDNFAPKKPEQQQDSFIKYIKNNLTEKEILNFANLIEKLSNKLTNSDIYFLDKIFSLNDRALQFLLLRLVHDEDFEKTLEQLLSALKTPNPNPAELALVITPIIQRNLRNINIWDLLQKIIESLDDTNKHKITALKILKLIIKFRDNPELLAAAQSLDKIISDYRPNTSHAEKIAWLKEFKKNPPEALKLSHRWARAGLWVNKILQIRDMPASLSEFLEKAFENEESYNLLINNTSILVNSGILQDIIELAELLKTEYPEADFEWLRVQIAEALDLPNLNYHSLGRLITLAKGFFPLERPLAEAPIVVVGTIVFKLLATNNHNQCELGSSTTDYAAYIKKWCEEVVYFMRDRKNGLIPLVQTLKSNS